MFLYAFILPLLDQLSSIAVQWAENLKGKLMIKATQIQNEINQMSSGDSEEIPESVTNVIGFQVPEEVIYEEDYDDDDDE